MILLILDLDSVLFQIYLQNMLSFAKIRMGKDKSGKLRLKHQIINFYNFVMFKFENLSFVFTIFFTIIRIILILISIFLVTVFIIHFILRINIFFLLFLFGFLTLTNIFFIFLIFNNTTTKCIRIIII